MFLSPPVWAMPLHAMPPMRPCPRSSKAASDSLGKPHFTSSSETCNRRLTGAKCVEDVFGCGFSGSKRAQHAEPSSPPIAPLRPARRRWRVPREKLSLPEGPLREMQGMLPEHPRQPSTPLPLPALLWEGVTWEGQFLCQRHGPKLGPQQATTCRALSMEFRAEPQAFTVAGVQGGWELGQSLTRGSVDLVDVLGGPCGCPL